MVVSVKVLGREFYSWFENVKMQVRSQERAGLLFVFLLCLATWVRIPNLFD